MPFNFPVAIVAIRDYVTNSLARLSADTLGWLAAIVLHCATLPSFLALMTGLSDRTPSLGLYYKPGLWLCYCLNKDKDESKYQRRIFFKHQTKQKS